MTSIRETLSPAWSFHTDSVNRYAYWTDCFSDQECEVIKATITHRFAMEEASIVGDNSNVKSIRDSNIVFVQPCEELQWVYRRLTDITNELNNRYFGFDLFGFTEGLQYTEYTAPGGKYDEHVDKIYNGVVRKLSIVVQLTDPSQYEGGDFELLDSTVPEKLLRSKGTLLAFPSYTLHRVTPVTVGTRNSLVGWVSGKPFK